MTASPNTSSALFRRLGSAAALLTFLLSGCGGGGGGGGSSAPALRFDQSRLAAQVVARTESAVLRVVISVTESVPDGALLVIGLVDPENVVAEARVSPFSNRQGELLLSTKPLNAAGRRTVPLQVLACRDPRCEQAYPGSPFTLTLDLNVLPNIELPPLVVLTRTGAEPTPSVEVTPQVPLAAGALFGTTTETAAGRLPINLRFDGNRHYVTTHQVPAGTYELRAAVASTSDSRYRAETLIRYEVRPPPGGEFGWRVTGELSFTAQEGERRIVPILVQPPTWIADPVTLDPATTLPPWLTLRSTGPGQWEAAASAEGQPADSRPGTPLRFFAGPDVEPLTVGLQMSVAPVWEVTGDRSLFVSRTARAEDLVLEKHVRMIDGSTAPATWQIDTPFAWFRPLQTSGRVGIDPIRLQLDPAALKSGLFGTRALVPPSVSTFKVGIDRPRSSSRTVDVGFSDELSMLDYALPARLLPGTGRIYLVGNYHDDLKQFPERLVVSGAREVGRRVLTYPFTLLQFTYLIVLDVDGLVAGQPVTVALDSGLNSRSLSIPVVADIPRPPAQVPLAAIARSAPVFSPALDALFWAEPQQVRIARRSGGSWSQQTLPVPLLIDVEVSADGLRLIALTPTHLIEFDALSLSELRRAALRDPTRRIEASKAAGLDKSLAVGLDDLTWMAVLSRDDFGNVSRSIARYYPQGPAEEMTFGPTLSVFRALDEQPAVTLIRSADRSAVLTQQRHEGFVLPVGFNYLEPFASVFSAVRTDVPPVGVASGGRLVVFADGTLVDTVTGEQVALAGLLPSGLTGLGYAVSTDGTAAFAYASRISGTAVAAEADATLLAFDLQPAPLRASLSASTPLLGVVNCATPAAAEECSRRVHLITDPHDREVMVSGRERLVVTARGSLLPLPSPSSPLPRFRAAVPGG